jgi:hypothetical protein
LQIKGFRIPQRPKGPAFEANSHANAHEPQTFAEKFMNLKSMDLKNMETKKKLCR